MDKLTIDIGENTKSCRIRDSFGRTRFIVSYIVLEEGNQNGKYLVKVREITDLKVPQDIVREFFPEDQCEKAKQTMERLVSDYCALVDSEQGKPDPRLVFNDSVNYRMVIPECCSNCVHALFEDSETELRKGAQRILCNCRKNLRQHQYACDLFGDGSLSSVEVDFGGICNNYHRNEIEFED